MIDRSEWTSQSCMASEVDTAKAQLLKKRKELEAMVADEAPQRAGWYMKKHRKLFWNTLVMIMTNDHHSCRQVYQHTHHYDHHHHHPRHHACHL